MKKQLVILGIVTLLLTTCLSCCSSQGRRVNKIKRKSKTQYSLPAETSRQLIYETRENR
jgi:hypothetical protein